MSSFQPPNCDKLGDKFVHKFSDRLGDKFVHKFSDKFGEKLLHCLQVHVAWLAGGTAIFAFRGTASKQDGLQDVKIFSRNIDYLQELYPGVKAHLGTLFTDRNDCVCCQDTAASSRLPFSIIGSQNATQKLQDFMCKTAQLIEACRSSMI